jgi:hypothetical protein
MITGALAAAIGMLAVFAGIYVGWLVHAYLGCMACLDAVRLRPLTWTVHRLRRTVRQRAS